jgi:phage shock protein PspC (stress-responsive transcriptional regulator)
MKKYYRDPEEGMAAGVIAGFGTHLQVDPLLLRAGLAYACLAGGTTVTGYLLGAYLLLWVCAPRVAQPVSVQDLDETTASTEETPPAQ